MGDQEQGRAPLTALGREQLEDLGRTRGVQAGGGLVGEDQLGLAEERAAEGDALALAAAQGLREVCGHRAEAEDLEELERARAVRGRGGRAGQQSRDEGVLHGVEVLQQLELLEHEPEALQAQASALLVAEGGEVLAEGPHAPGAGHQDARGQVHHGGLAAPGRAHEGHLLAALDAEVGGAQLELAVGVREAHALELQGGGGRHSSRASSRAAAGSLVVTARRRWSRGSCATRRQPSAARSAR